LLVVMPPIVRVWSTMIAANINTKGTGKTGTYTQAYTFRE
jgi:hypothetical protein